MLYEDVKEEKHVHMKNFHMVKETRLNLIDNSKRLLGSTTSHHYKD
jgi:hypothetical protein